MSGWVAKLGVEAAFGPKADFSGLLTPAAGIGISELASDIRVDFDEGTKAEAEAPAPAPPPPPSAQASAEPSASAAPAAKAPQRFSASRPFLFVVRDTKSGSLLLVGRFARP
jgi:serine protease inhibitor